MDGLKLAHEVDKVNKEALSPHHIDYSDAYNVTVGGMSMDLMYLTSFRVY